MVKALFVVAIHLAAGITMRDVQAKLHRIREDIFPFRSLNYEVLSGDKKGISSIRVNSQYRIEFTVNKIEDKEPVLTICNILELSNHYK